MDNLEIGQWPLNVSRVSLLRFALLINMLISGVVIKMFYLGKGGGGERKKGGRRRVQKKEKAGEGAKKQRR